MWPFRSKPGIGRTSDKTASNASSLGPRGETLARKRLRRAGLKILAANYRCPAGEADLIALDRRDGQETLVFVEVKARTSDRYTDPESAVNADKRRRLRKVARYFIAVKNAEDLPVRFDVVSVLLKSGQPPDIRHIPDAF